jgi:hypothetical protein
MLLGHLFMRFCISSAEATSELPVTQPQADELDLVSVIRSLDFSMSESVILQQLI